MCLEILKEINEIPRGEISDLVWIFKDEVCNVISSSPETKPMRYAMRFHPSFPKIKDKSLKNAKNNLNYRWIVITIFERIFEIRSR